MKNLILFFALLLVVPVMAQTDFKNGLNTMVFSSLESDSTWNDTSSVYKFNRDVLYWGTTVSWDSVFSGTAIIIPEVNNLDNDSTWSLYPGLDTITITDTNGVATWHDDGFRFLYGRWRFVNSDTLIHGQVTITDLVKTYK